MRILISNDDGYRAPGLNCLAEALSSSHEVTVVAPERDHSGASNSLTLINPIRVHQAPNGFYVVDGTPTDSVHLALQGLLDEPPDMVVSGINAGANLGDDVIYSGTVAAAMEGRFLGCPAIAMSLANIHGKNYEAAAQVALSLVEQVKLRPLPGDTILNVNVPDVPLKDIQGFKVTRLGNRHRAEPIVEDTDPRGRTIYWVGPPGKEQDAGAGTDFDAINQRYVSLTPLLVDLTRRDALEPLSDWAADISLESSAKS